MSVMVSESRLHLLKMKKCKVKTDQAKLDNILWTGAPRECIPSSNYIAKAFVGFSFRPFIT